MNEDTQFKPLVTVIVPAYNHELYIEECLSSVVNQVYPNLQIIVINDGSKDKTGVIIEKFIKNQDRVIEYISKHNEGVCKTLNMGLKLAKGKYIAFLASDDIWLPNRIEEQVLFLEQNDKIGLVFSDAYIIRYDNKTTTRDLDFRPNIKKYFINSIQNNNIYEMLLIENFIIALTVLIRTECIEKVGLFDTSLKYEDYDMWLRISKHFPIAYIDKPLAYYRIHNNNTSNNKIIMLHGALQTLFKQYKSDTLKGKYVKILVLFLKFIFIAIKNKLRKVKH